MEVTDSWPALCCTSRDESLPARLTESKKLKLAVKTPKMKSEVRMCEYKNVSVLWKPPSAVPHSPEGHAVPVITPKQQAALWITMHYWKCRFNTGDRHIAFASACKPLYMKVSCVIACFHTCSYCHPDTYRCFSSLPRYTCLCASGAWALNVVLRAAANIWWH